MSVYYNEVHPIAVQWLRNLIRAGVIADGDIDDRSIEYVRPDDLRGYRQCHFFAGIGVWSWALRQAGWEDSHPVWTGSCPCQPFSVGGKGKGFADERHLWPAWFHLIQQCRPNRIIGEQVSSKDGLQWFQLVQSDLENTGYASSGLDLCAASVGAPQIRQRLYWVANADGKRLEGPFSPLNKKKWENGQTPALRPSSPVAGFWGNAEWVKGRDGKLRGAEPGSYPLAYGPSQVVGRLHAYGNAIVAPLASKFVEVVKELL